MVQCQECGGEMEPRRVEVYGRWGEHGRPVLVTGVPAMVCKQCGQQDLDGPTAQRVAELWRDTHAGTVVPLTVRGIATR